jgi:hypothetical protein
MSAPFDRILAIDFETVYDSREYTLRKLTTEEYIRDVRFKAFGLCVHELGSSEPVIWIKGRDIADWAATIDWNRTAVLAHNAQFDVAILGWHYNAHPAFIFDTLSMARALRGVEVGNSLAKLAEEFGLPAKGTAINSTDGLIELSPRIEKELAEYCAHDVYLCEQIFERLGKGYPKSELRLIDMTLKMYTRPLLELDSDMLTDALYAEREQREALLKRLNITDGVLASNPKFAELLRTLGVEPPMKNKRPTVKTPNPEGKTFAFAKNDAMFQALLNGSNEDVALLCEARLKVKSTTERTRAQRFLEISQRGRLPVPLSYYGALSGRWTASKGSAINMQNLKRGSFLRKAIMAPEGHVLAVGDLSQIEPRVLAWLSDYDEMLDIFRAKGDPYAEFGAQMFNIPGMTKKSHPALRQSAKSALLGCFGPDTPVLTQRGWVAIVSVQATDTVWDGEEWVQHHGVIPQGEKDVLTALGISATSDHEILTEHGWVEWNEVLQSPSHLQSARSLASLFVSVGNGDRMGLNGEVNLAISPRCDALAGGRGLLIAPISDPDVLLGVTIAQKRKRQQRGCLPQATKPFAQIDRIETGSSTALARSSAAALTQTAQCTQTMVGEVSRSIRRGLQTVLSFCATLLGCRVGISPSCSLTGQTTAKATSRETFASSHAASTCPTSERSLPEKSSNSSAELKPLKQRMQTYDIAYAGPRNRYTVLTDAGPLIVHNCGYGLGWASFAAQLLVGFLGAPPVRYDKAVAKQLGVTSDYIDRFLDWDENIIRMQEIPRVCSMQELLIHCVAAKKIIDIYRATAYPVVGLWELCGSLIQRSLADGEEYRHKCLVFRKEEIVLPNGMSLLYPNLRQQKDERGRPQWVYGSEATKLYAGKITNNCLAEGTLVLTDVGWVAIEKVKTSHKVHDGVEFVSHSGKVFNGVQTCVTMFGVALTPEHKVLTNDGWREASQVQEPYRPYLWHVDGASARLIYWEGVAVAVPVPVREEVREAGVGRGKGGQAGRHAELRVRHEKPNWAGEYIARDEQAPSVHRVAKYGESLHEAFGTSVQKLRWAGHNSVRTLVNGVRNILGRYAGHVSAGVGARSEGQQRPLCPGELPLGNAPRQRDEPQKNRAAGGCYSAEQKHGDTVVNDLLQAGAGVASGAVGQGAECKKPVYDIVNAGPRSRFVVLGTEGPFIVHNCVQATARIVMTDGMLRTAKRYPVAGTVHDEQIVVVPEHEAQDALSWVLDQMTAEPKYMPGIPLAADGGVHRRYGLAKD